jgi:hypothetical protein
VYRGYKLFRLLLPPYSLIGTCVQNVCGNVLKLGAVVQPDRDVCAEVCGNVLKLADTVQPDRDVCAERLW